MRKKRWLLILFLLIALFIIPSVLAGWYNGEDWNRIYDPGSGYDAGWNSLTDSSGNFYILGQTASPGTLKPVILKYDSNGNLLWNQVGDDYGGCLGNVAKDSSNSIYYITCSALYKYSSSGTQIFKDTSIKGLAVDLDSSGNIYIIPFSYSSKPLNITKYNSNRNLLWTKEFNGFPANTQIISIHKLIVGKDGNIYIYGSNSGNQQYQMFVLKYDSNGNLLWSKFFDAETVVEGLPESLTGLIRTNSIYVGSSGNVYFLSLINLRKLDSSGNLLWTKSIISSNYGEILATGMDFDGSNFYIVKSGQLSSIESNDVFVSKHDSSGNLLCTKISDLKTGQGKDDYGETISVSGNNVYVAGRTVMSITPAPANQDIFSLKHSANSFSGTNCYTGCRDECASSGLKECVGPSAYKTCGNYDADTCLEWSSVVNCPSGQTCSNGNCVAAPCTNECTTGGKQCFNTTAYQTCGNYDADTCLEWSAVTACPFRLVCSNGNCVPVPPCTNECTTGGKQCFNTTAYQTCGNYDADTCLEFSSPILCPSGQTCSNGNCIISPACTPGTIKPGTTCLVCNPAGTAYIQDNTKCSTGQICNLTGSCVSSCTSCVVNGKSIYDRECVIFENETKKCVAGVLQNSNCGECGVKCKELFKGCSNGKCEFKSGECDDNLAFGCSAYSTQEECAGDDCGLINCLFITTSEFPAGICAENKSIFSVNGSCLLLNRTEFSFDSCPACSEELESVNCYSLAYDKNLNLIQDSTTTKNCQIAILPFFSFISFILAGILITAYLFFKTRKMP